MSVINPLSFDKIELKEETHYHGTVVDNSDPLQIGRLKIRIEELFGTGDEIPDSALPWAIKCSSPSFGGGSNISGFSVPEVGSKLLVKFLRGDIYSPMYVGRLSDASNKITGQEVDYPNTYILKDKKGNKVAVNMTQNTLSLVFNGDAVVDIVETSGKGNITINVARTATIACKNAVITATEKAQINCATSEVNASGTAKITAPETTVDGNATVTGNLNVTGDIVANTVTDNQGDLAQRKANDTGGIGQWALIP